MSSKLSTPLFVQLELTEGCNHKCGYCSNPFSKNRIKIPSIDEIKVYLSKLLESKVFSIVLTGGEPFTNRQGLHYSLDVLKDKPTEVYVNTNLSNPLTSEDLIRLRTVDYILVSFPSRNEEKFNKIVSRHSFKKVVANLEILAKEGISFGVNQVVTMTNYRDVFNTVMFLHEKVGLKEFSASPVIPACNKSSSEFSITPMQILELADQLVYIEDKIGVKTDMLTFIPPCFFPEKIIHHRLAAHGCSAGRDSAVVGATGNVRRCALLGESYGNLQNEDLKVIWGRMQLIEKPINDQCQQCMPHEYCFGGCEARAKAYGGKDPFIKGLPRSRKLNLYKILEDLKVLTLERVMFREESDGYLIGHGGSYVRGNEALLTFIKRIEGKTFSVQDVKRDFGETGIKLITYLYNRGVLKECNSK